MDSDDDQELTIEEFLGVFMGQGEGRDNKRVEKRQQSKKIRFAPMDTDKSGTVSISEWMTEGQQRFAAADTDNDGIVTPWEFRSRARH
jgi:Ca2+-binding EF-hand superfamily protein